MSNMSLLDTGNDVVNKSVKSLEPHDQNHVKPCKVCRLPCLFVCWCCFIVLIKCRVNTAAKWNWLNWTHGPKPHIKTSLFVKYIQVLQTNVMQSYLLRGCGVTSQSVTHLLWSLGMQGRARSTLSRIQIIVDISAHIFGPGSWFNCASRMLICRTQFIAFSSHTVHPWTWHLEQLFCFFLSSKALHCLKYKVRVKGENAPKKTCWGQKHGSQKAS